MNTQQLMQMIHDKFHSQLSAAVAASSLPESFIAALVAIESAGNPNAMRFEPLEFQQFCLLLIGHKASFAPKGIRKPLSPEDVMPYLDTGKSIEDACTAVNLQHAMINMADLSTSWGLTQIMGWHAVEWRTTFGRSSGVGEQLAFTTRLMGYFADLYQLDMKKDFDQLFACWNTGGPDVTKTFDPNYVTNGLARMQIYAQILAAPPAAAA